MAPQLEKLLNSYYEDSIELADGQIMLFKKVFNYRGTDRPAIEIALEDLDNHIVIEISTYFDGKWIFSTPTHENMFWSIVKPNYGKIRSIITKMQEAPESRDMFAYQLRFKQARTSAENQLVKLLQIFKL
jgi:hypothetical protein